MSGFVEAAGEMPGVLVPDGWIKRGFPEGDFECSGGSALVL